MKEKTLKAIRGAVCSDNTAESITKNAVELYDKILAANGLSETDIVSLFFSVTPDITALNPATAIRQSGRAGDIAMMVFQEAAVEGGLPGTIRAMIHCYMPAENPVQYIYVGGAEKLRKFL